MFASSLTSTSDTLCRPLPGGRYTSVGAEICADSLLVNPGSLGEPSNFCEHCDGGHNQQGRRRLAWGMNSFGTEPCRHRCKSGPEREPGRAQNASCCEKDLRFHRRRWYDGSRRHRWTAAVSQRCSSVGEPTRLQRMGSRANRLRRRGSHSVANLVDPRLHHRCGSSYDQHGRQRLYSRHRHAGYHRDHSHRRLDNTPRYGRAQPVSEPTFVTPIRTPSKLGTAP